jgi:hypothetical protein
MGCPTEDREASEGWWARQDSNLQPDAYERGAEPERRASCCHYLSLLGFRLFLMPWSAELLRPKQVQKVWSVEPSFCAPLRKAGPGHVPLEWRR